MADQKGTLNINLGDDAEIGTNEFGGKGTILDVRFDLLDAGALFKLAAITGHGARKYKAWNWLKVPVEEHLNHALTHQYAYLAGDTQDDHLEHAFCRLMMALGVHLRHQESESEETK